MYNYGIISKPIDFNKHKIIVQRINFLQLTIIIMFQHLLKRAKAKNSELVQKQFENLGNHWQTPLANRHERNQHPEEDQQTPSFLNRLNKISRRIQIVEEDLQQGFQHQQNQKSSQVQFVDDLIDQELPPMILSNINNPIPKINRLICLRLRNATLDLRQAYFGLTQYLQDQRKIMQDFHQKIVSQVEHFCGKFRSRSFNESSNTEIQQLKAQNYILRQKLQKKEAEHQRLNQQIMICNNCKQLQSILTNLQEERSKSEETIQKLQISNQQLQQHIFDIQQKIVGVELEVERRLKEQLTLLPEYYNSRASNNKEVQLLKAQIKALQENSKKMEQQLALSKQIQLTFERLKLAQQQLRKVQARSQEIKQANYQRQQQILEAQENLSTKINDFRNKQADLSSWEAELTRKQAEVRNLAFQIKVSNQQANHRASQSNQIKISRQISLKSFGRVPRQEEEPQRDFITRPRQKTYENSYELTNQEPRREYYQASHDNGKRRIESKSYLQIQNFNANKDKYNGFNRKPGLSGSNYRDARESSPYRMVTEQRNRLQHVGGRNTSQYRDLSKNSRHSGTKSMKNGYSFTSNHPKIHNQGHQLTGLGSKLQRLRQQIKKEIQSIK